MSSGPAFPGQVFALACALVFLAFLSRRTPWARWTPTTPGTLTLIGAGLL